MTQARRIRALEQRIAALEVEDQERRKAYEVNLQIDGRSFAKMLAQRASHEVLSPGRIIREEACEALRAAKNDIPEDMR